MDWFWFWLLFVVIFLLMPVGYGWGYRGWGAPYPSYYRARRARRAPPGDPYRERDVVVAEEESTWGVLADMIWIALAIAAVWFVVGWLF